MSQLTIFARPARETNNPYTALLADALERQGLAVREVGMSRRDFPFSDDVLLLHWPDEFYKRPHNLKAWISSWLRLAHLALARKLGGLKIVWIAHNARPHILAPEAPPQSWHVFLGLLDGIISLSQDAMDEVIAVHPALRAKPRLVTAHGHYLGQAIADPCLPEQVGDRPVRLAALGAIRPNKRFADLARAVAASKEGPTLTVRGKPARPVFAAELSDIAASCPRISLTLGHMSDADFESETDAADLIVLPYADILNSGVLFYALSRFRPVVAPKRGSIPQVREQVGRNWIYLFDGDFDSDTLAEAEKWLRTTRRTSPPDLSTQDWDTIGADMASFLRSLFEGRKQAPARGETNRP